MASRINPITLDDPTPSRRLAQFAVQAPAAVSRTAVSPKRRILGLPARIPVLTNGPRRPAASHDRRLDAA